MSGFTRRTFLRSAIGAGATTALMARHVQGANDAVRVGVLGVGRRGDELAEQFRQLEGVRVVVLCDPDRDALGACAAKRFGGEVDSCADLRRVLDRKDVDAIVCATPDHWHSLATIWACQAGKDVYVEKPVSHDPFEGRRMVEAAQRHGRIVQAGFQNRSDTGLCAAFDWLAGGKLGKLLRVRGVLSRARQGIGARAAAALKPPEGLDYDLWLGPARDEPIFRPRFHHDWHWIWNYGGGEIGNHGPHVLDMCLWALGDPGLPRSVQSFGARFAWNDAGETPNMQVAQFEFGSVPVLVEVHALAATPAATEPDKVHGIDTGVILEYERGEFRGDRGGGTAFDPEGKVLAEFPGDNGTTHARNFIDALRSRATGSLRSPIEQAHVSSALAHLASASLRTGRAVPGAELVHELGADPRAGEVLARFREYLRAWNVDDAAAPWRLGPRLAIDRAAERFDAGAAGVRANALLRRECRATFRVPEKV